MTAALPSPKHWPGHAPAGSAARQHAQSIRLPAPRAADDVGAARVLNEAPAGAPHVLHIDRDQAAALALSILLTPEARVTHVPTLAAARELLKRQIFSAVVIDHQLPDGDAAELLPALAAIPLLVYSASEPVWRGQAGAYLPKPWTQPRRLWTTIARMLGISNPTFAGD
ncbi:response regulator [Massilia sp. R2A-15]|uniref:response regulator n=1 Tax=Massilia sp. R2A-15 TaxID=3064278 RepID=UPI002736131E|nr:response regulator [Massilia sp. R2A-15]WLI89757.1 response regulator [Massilia sp. R2A-15]